MKMETKQNQSVDGGGLLYTLTAEGFLYRIPTMYKIFCRCFTLQRHKITHDPRLRKMIIDCAHLFILHYLQ